MEKKIRKIVMKPFNLEILNFCKEKNNIQEISNKVGLSYKSTFVRIKELEKNGIVQIVKKRKEGNNITINPNLEEAINFKINLLKENDKALINAIKKPHKKEYILGLLNQLSKRRFLEKDIFLDKMNCQINLLDFITLNDSLEKAGLIKERWDITKKGKRFLKENGK